MKVILTTDVKKLGRKGDIIEVAKGYALNFLVPQKRAEVATMSALAEAERRHERNAVAVAERSEAIKSALKPLMESGITLSAAANEKGHLFAAIHSADIAQTLTERSGVEIPESVISVGKEVKEVGEYKVVVAVGEEELGVPVVVSAAEEAATTA
ncbi:MAG: 50S ribosomal protein L9, partial [Candidatus Paceibacterota bacterium]